jgi:hypothetical protein
LLTIDEVLDPEIEKKGDHHFGDRDAGEEEIVELVKRQKLEASGMVADGKSDDDNDTPMAPSLSNGEIMNLCQRLKMVCLDNADLKFSMSLLTNLQYLQAHAHKAELQSLVQAPIFQYFQPVDKN